MDTPESGSQQKPTTEHVLGYLNFSAGIPDPQFLRNVNELFRGVEQHDGGSEQPSRASWRIVGGTLRGELDRLQRESSAFRDATQARWVLDLTLDRLLPEYLEYHRDLLFHHTEATLFQPFFIGRVFEAVLSQASSRSDPERAVQGALSVLNCFVGYRPVPMLETRKHEPYQHEWVRPIPLYIRDAGVAAGRFHNVVQRAIEILNDTDEEILYRAGFDPEKMEEFSIDPRAFDFDHPVAKRPNYQFGLWDPHHLDQTGHFDRFVMQQVTLEALMQRVEQPDDLPLDELLTEAAAVLAGTILMASGVSGPRPEAHDSTTTLATLLPNIAAYRDAFYERLLDRLTGDHANRLKIEWADRQQPFGAARQNLNAQLARGRAAQMQRVQLARIFARMGYPQGATRQVEIVPVASARMQCQIECQLTEVRRELANGKLVDAVDRLNAAVDVLHRAIDCGGAIDPWNILGFSAQFSLFPTPENSVPDTRADELIELMETVFELFARVWSEAATWNEPALCERIATQFRALAEWWHQFAVHEVSDVDGFHALDAYTAAERTAEALGHWHRGGAAGGDLQFWAPHAELFDSPKAYVMVIEALLDRNDFVASRALLVHWIHQADRVGLQLGESSFSAVAIRWLREVQQSDDGSDESPAQVLKFFDYLEANADQFWQVPTFDLSPDRTDEQEDGEEDESADETVYDAAYQDMVYRDSTDDGYSGSVFDSGVASDDEWDQQARALFPRLTFLQGLAQLWKAAARDRIPTENVSPQRRDALQGWFLRANSNLRGLTDLLISVHRFRIPSPSGDHESMVEYDRQRFIKDNLIERIVDTCVETGNAQRVLSAMLVAEGCPAPPRESKQPDADGSDILEVDITAAIYRCDPQAVRDCWDVFLDSLTNKPLLYVPLSKGGNPRKIVQARLRQRLIEELLASLPRLGLLVQTCELIGTARSMERNHTARPGAVTEFDQLFETGIRALVASLAGGILNWDRTDDDVSLFDCMQRLTYSLLNIWLSHSRTLRLSVLEKLDDSAWQELVEFIERYGGDLFTQRFMHLANLRAILHQGTGTWLDQLGDENHQHVELHILKDLGRGVSHADAAECLSVIIDSIVENYAEYRDYNSTTTQSDQGEMLYMLLDFLRLRSQYDRIAWNLRPLVLVHASLLHSKRHAEADRWYRAFIERTLDHAHEFLSRLAELQSKYAMQMSTVADRLNEQFIQPLTTDRVLALIKPAVCEADQPTPQTAFDLLEHETNALAEVPTGVGLDPPAWIEQLDEEVASAHAAAQPGNEADRLDQLIPYVRLSSREVEEQLSQWEARQDTAS